MQNKNIQIVGIDEKSKLRGVGRYVQALESVVLKIDLKEAQITINPFFAVSGTKISQSPTPLTKSIAVVHDLIPLKYHDKFPLGIMGRLKLRINKSRLKKYNIVITDSIASATDIEKMLRIPKEMIRVIYPFSPLTTSKKIISRPTNLDGHISKNGFLLYVGDVNWHKNIVQILKSCIGANIPLVCVGKSFELVKSKISNHKELAELREFQKVFKENPNQIHLLGYLDDSEVSWLYENALANILISHDEGFGYSYIEAGHFSTPSIVSDIPIFREISNSKGAFFVDHNSTDTIVQQIVKLKNSPEIRNEAGNDAKIRSIFFSEEKFVSDWKKLLLKMI